MFSYSSDVSFVSEINDDDGEEEDDGEEMIDEEAIIRESQKQQEAEREEKRKKERKKMYITTGIGIFACLVLIIVSTVIKYNANNNGFAQTTLQNIGKFFDLKAFFVNRYPSIIESLIIIFFIWIVSKICELIVAIITIKGKRSVTIGKLIVSIVKYSAVIFGVFMILSAWGVQTPTLLASAGILGLAISLGAQSLIEDVLSGLFIIFEKQFAIGDIIQINDFRGKVVEIGIRTTKFEDLAGDIKIINNSDIRAAINTTSNLSPAICDIPIGYNADLKAIEKVIINNLGKTRKRIPKIKEGPYYYGVQSLDASGISLRVYTKCNEQDKYQVKRDLNRELKLLFDDYGIIIPFNQIVVHRGEDNVKEENVVSPHFNDKGKLIIPVRSKKYKVYRRAIASKQMDEFFSVHKNEEKEK